MGLTAQMVNRVIAAVFLFALLSVLQACAPVRTQTQPVTATDYSFYKGSLDPSYRPVTRVNGYLKSEPSAMCYMSIKYLGDMPEVVGIGRWYGPDGSLVHEGKGQFNPRKAGDSSVWTFGTDKISQISKNTGIWRLEMYNGPYLLFIEYFSVGDYLVDVSITGVPGKYAQKLAIDGKEAGTISGGEKKPSALTAGTHTISVNALINATSDTRYVTESNKRTVQSEGSQTFEYHIQYYLNVNSPQGKTKGSGWYSEGTKATFSAESPVNVSHEVRYLFTKWSGNYAGDSPDATILMDGPKNATANYKIQYYLKIESKYGSPKGEGWHDKGSTVTVSVLSSENLPDGSKVFFVKWTDDMISSDSAMTILMDKPHTVTANWRVEPAPVFMAQPLLAIGVLIIVAVALFVVLVLRRKRKKED